MPDSPAGGRPSAYYKQVLGVEQTVVFVDRMHNLMTALCPTPHVSFLIALLSTLILIRSGAGAAVGLI